MRAEVSAAAGVVLVVGVVSAGSLVGVAVVVGVSAGVAAGAARFTLQGGYGAQNRPRY